jgi:hypothetical protein
MPGTSFTRGAFVIALAGFISTPFAVASERFQGTFAAGPGKHNRLGHVTFTGSGFANDQSTCALGNEFKAVQLEASLSGYLGVKAPLKVSQAQTFIESTRTQVSS